MSYRILFDCILGISIFFLPWWIPFLAACIAVFFLDSFYEIVVLGVIIDSLYNAPIVRFHNIQFVITFLALFVTLIGSFIKNKLRFYN
ncbi:MAG: hypothetical protein V4519_02355 [Patescibacteria group bacterium]